MKYRRPANKGMRCQQWQRVSGPGNRRVLRCKSYTYPPRRAAMGYRRGHTPDNYGASCKRRKKVWSPWYNKMVWRCALFGPGRGRTGLFSRGLFLPAAPRKRVREVKIPKLKTMTPILIEGRIPMSMPSMEKQIAGRTSRPTARGFLTR